MYVRRTRYWSESKQYYSYLRRRRSHVGGRGAVGWAGSSGPARTHHVRAPGTSGRAVRTPGPGPHHAGRGAELLGEAVLQSPHPILALTDL